MNDLSVFQFYDKYSRWNDEQGRRETWEETVDRTFSFLQNAVLTRFGKRKLAELDSEFLEARNAVLNMDVIPSMRILQLAGPALERCNIGSYNCTYLPVNSIKSFCDALYLSMSGCGVGYSVESMYVNALPRIKYQKNTKSKNHFVIPDDTEGWCEALNRGMKAWFSGEDITFDYSEIRKYGTRLKTKGGIASGPEPLRELLTFARSTILTRQSGHLSTLNCHDIMTKIGSVVQLGGVRRSAMLSLSDLEDSEMKNCKTGSFFFTHPWRSCANNSVVFEEQPSSSELVREMLAVIESGTGERGIFNRQGAIENKPSRRSSSPFGVNPCGEIVLRNFETCNLTSAIARFIDDFNLLKKKVRIASFIGTIQSILDDFKFVSREFVENLREERLLGVDITGQYDSPVMRDATEEQLCALKAVAVDTNRKYAKILGINRSVAVTCVKPSGNSSVLLNCSAGMHARYSKYYIRRVRVSANSPMSAFLIDSGVPNQPEVGSDPSSPRTMVFEFPVSAEDSIVRDDVGAMDQLNRWLILKKNYTEHNPSCFSGSTLVNINGKDVRFDSLEKNKKYSAVGFNKKPVDAFYVNGGIDTIHELICEVDGEKILIETTENHLWPMFDGRFLMTSELTTGDRFIYKDGYKSCVVIGIKNTLRQENVHCLFVPSDSLFYLSSGILTHNCTIYVKEGEWIDVIQWLQKNWQFVGGITMLPYDGGVYTLAPYEEITREEFDLRSGKLLLNWKNLSKYETNDSSSPLSIPSCEGDVCELTQN